MKRPQLISPGSLNRLVAGADQAWQRRDFQQSIELLERASRLDPANSRILLHLGRTYGLRHQAAEAERCFEKAVRLAPNKAESLAAAGRMAVESSNYQMAERYFRQALEQKCVSADTIARLAELYERLNRAEDAAAMVERALRLENVCPLALLTRARLHRQAGRLTEAEQALRPALTTTDREIRIRALYERGAISDRQGRYDEAMSTFGEAKTLLQPDATPFVAARRTIYTRLKVLTESLRSQVFQRWFDAVFDPKQRLALLGGHPRSGTTLLEQVLDSHPDIVSVDETEIFLDETYLPLARHLPPNTPMLPVLEAAQSDSMESARANYFRTMELLLGQPINGRMLIDKNPSYTSLIPALVRIFPEIKLLIALRDPRDVVLSCFMQPFFHLSKVNATYLTLAGTAEEYAAVMNVWLAVKPLLKNPWLEVRYEDMVEDLESVARQTLDFLGVPWNSQVLGFDRHARDKAVRSPTYADVAQPVYKRARGRWRNYQKYLEQHLETLAPFVKAFGYE